VSHTTIENAARFVSTGACLLLVGASDHVQWSRITTKYLVEGCWHKSFHNFRLVS